MQRWCRDSVHIIEYELFLLVRCVLVCGTLRKVCTFWIRVSLHRAPLSCLHRPQRFSETDLLACCEVKSEVLWSFKKQNDGGAQVELAQVLTFAQTHALLVVVGHVAKVVVGAFTVTRVVGTQLLQREEMDLVNAMHRTCAFLTLNMHIVHVYLSTQLFPYVNIFLLNLRT